MLKIKSKTTGIMHAAHQVSRFLNRELQLLAFNRRVLAQAQDRNVPLLERLKFLSIVSSNMDEFFEIRVAGLKEQIKLNSIARDADGRSARETFRAVAFEAQRLVALQYGLLNDELFPAMAAQGIHFVRRAQWTPTQLAWVRDYFFRELMPVLTPIGLDPAHPFPRIFNKSLNFAVELSGRDAFGRESLRAIVQAPRVLPRVIRFPKEASSGENDFVFLTSVLHAHVGELFSGMEVLGCYQFRVTRNSDLFVDEEEVKNLRLALQGELPQRHLGDAVRLEVADNCSTEMEGFLLAQFELDEVDLYRVNGPVNLVRLMSVPDEVARPDLKYAPFIPGVPKPIMKVARGKDIFETLKKQDVLLHHPFQSFAPVIEFIQQAARDPQVLAIKQTVYRTGTDSVIMESLIDAAKRGKEVTVVVELMARFDEEANLNWAAKLEEVGAHVVYGVVGHKTHAKMALIVRREYESGDDGKRVLRRYVHLGTGNYHPRTSRLYTDFGLITANEAICADVNEVFVQLTGLGKATKLAHVWQAPFTLHERVLHAIDHETKLAKAGKRSLIIAKMNSLLEIQVIEALYRASAAGVQINLIIRGVCALRPGVAGLSENIRVRSVVGRFLEHSRIFYFRNDGEERVMLSSADWMERNFFRRIELSFPILDPKLKKRVINEGLTPYLRDNVQAWDMDGEGGYVRRKPAAGSRGVRRVAQEQLLNLLAVPE
jgi:polyphosphate kinase